MKEAFARCLSGPISLAEDQWRERDVDRLHALASAARGSALSALGVSLMALKGSNRPDEYARSVNQLAHFLRLSKPRPSLEVRTRIARQAVSEWVVDFCPTCRGTGEIPAQDGLEGAQRMVPCPPDPKGCGGHGKRRYTNQERLDAIGVKTLREVDRWMADAMSFISRAESEAHRTGMMLLERW